MISDWKEESKITVLCTELVPFLQAIFKEMIKDKDANLAKSLAHLFSCMRPSKPYIYMICHSFEALHQKAIQHVFQECKKQVEDGTFYF
jgi:hypothetical protein